jgi:hypothetical protein
MEGAFRRIECDKNGLESGLVFVYTVNSVHEELIGGVLCCRM